MVDFKVFWQTKDFLILQIDVQILEKVVSVL